MILNSLNFGKKITRFKARFSHRQRNRMISDIRVIAVTGSAGKTATGHLIYHILQHAGISTAFLSTSGIWMNGRLVEPDFVMNVAHPREFNEHMKSLSKHGVQAIVVEAPASSIAVHKLDGIKFDSMVMTNIGGGEFANGFSSELEYAETMFSITHQVVDEGLAVLNADDDAAEWIAEQSTRIRQNLFAAWVSKYEASDIDYSIKGTRFKYEGAFFESKTISSLYLENVLLAIKLCTKYLGLDQIDNALNEYLGLPGREQIIKTHPYTVVVDYAYQPLVIDMLLADMRSILPPGNKMVAVLGAAGQRGNNRKKIGIPAVKHSDVVVLCPQDPRSENVTSINTKIGKFAEEYGGVIIDRIVDHQEYEGLNVQNLIEKMGRVVQNGDIPMVAFDNGTPAGRYDAIDFAINLADPGDLVVIMGKGDDDVIDFGDTLYEWSDAGAVKDVLDHLSRDHVNPDVAAVIE